MFPLLNCKNTILVNTIKRFTTKSNFLMCAKTNQHIDNNTEQFTPIFKTSEKAMPYFIGLNRWKTFQSIGIFGLIPASFGLNQLGFLTLEEVIGASLIGVGLTAGIHLASLLLTNNLVIFVYMSEDEQMCRMSYVSYWGKRAELYCNIEDIEPITFSKLDLFNYKIKVKGNNNTFKMVIADATFFNNAKFRLAFGSEII